MLIPSFNSDQSPLKINQASIKEANHFCGLESRIQMATKDIEIEIDTDAAKTNTNVLARKIRKIKQKMLLTLHNKPIAIIYNSDTKTHFLIKKLLYPHKPPKNSLALASPQLTASALATKMNRTYKPKHHHCLRKKH